MKMWLPVVLVSLLLGGLPATHATAGTRSCNNNGIVVLHGMPLVTVDHKCVQILCLNGLPMPKLFENANSGCCEFKNTLYAPGQVFLDGCVKMTCEKSKWKPVGNTEFRCKRCEVFNDPHFMSFDRHRFDYHGECTYALTQEQFSRTPNFGIFTEFKKCYAVPSCLHRTIFKDNPKLLIGIGYLGLNAPKIYDILINGEKFTIPGDNYAHRLIVKEEDQDVLVWRQGSCIRILGSNGLTLQQCTNSIDIWAHPDLKNKVNGLCGSPDDNIDNDFTSRGKQVFDVEGFAPQEFAESWLTPPGCPAGRKKGSAKAREVVDKCWGNVEDWNLLSGKCNEAVENVKHNNRPASAPLTGILRDACTFDLCMIKNGEQNPEPEMDKWLNTVQEMTEQRIFVETMTEGCDHAKGECSDIGVPPKPPAHAHTVCNGNGCVVDLLFNPAVFSGKPIRIAR